MPLSEEDDSENEMSLLAADFLDGIHSSDDDDDHDHVEPQSTQATELRPKKLAVQPRVDKGIHTEQNTLIPSSMHPAQQPLRTFQQGHAPRRQARSSETEVEEQEDCTNSAVATPGDVEDDNQQAFGDIDLASIRAVYKEEVGNSHELDGVLCEHGCADVHHASQLRKTELGYGLDAFVLDNVISQAECQRLIKVVESMGFSFWNPASDRKDYRNADTVEVTNQALADRLWERMKHLAVPSVTISPGQGRWSRELEGRWEAVGVNPNMLFNRYGAGGHFSPHTDGYTILDYNVRSMYSCLIYLNGCPCGGATRMMEESGDALTDHSQERFVLDEEGRHRFEDHRVRASVSPESGKALLFFQDTLHEGEPVGEGHCKYMIRTDILYQRTPKTFDSPAEREAYALFRQAELTEAEDAAEAAKMFRRFARMAPALAEVYGI